jgi:hypothetical protein
MNRYAEDNRIAIETPPAELAIRSNDPGHGSQGGRPPRRSLPSGTGCVRLELQSCGTAAQSFRGGGLRTHEPGPSAVSRGRRGYLSAERKTHSPSANRLPKHARS